MHPLIGKSDTLHSEHPAVSKDFELRVSPCPPCLRGETGF